MIDLAEQQNGEPYDLVLAAIVDEHHTSFNRLTDVATVGGEFPAALRRIALAVRVFLTFEASIEVFDLRDRERAHVHLPMKLLDGQS